MVVELLVVLVERQDFRRQQPPHGRWEGRLPLVTAAATVPATLVERMAATATPRRQSSDGLVVKVDREERQGRRSAGPVSICRPILPSPGRSTTSSRL